LQLVVERLRLLMRGSWRSRPGSRWLRVEAIAGDEAGELLHRCSPRLEGRRCSPAAAAMVDAVLDDPEGRKTLLAGSAR
jgi:hypothetical protein